MPFPQVESPRIINSILSSETEIGNGSVVINCNLQTPIKVGEKCFISGLSDSFSELQVLSSV